MKPFQLKMEKAKDEKQLGNEAYRKRDYELAMTHYLSAIELDPKEMAFLSNAAAVKFEEKKFAECAEYCAKAVEVGRVNGGKVEAMEKALLRRHRALANLGNASAEIIDVAVGNQDEKVFKCDRGMLSDNCKYFKALFEYANGEKKESVRLDNITPETFEDILDILKDPTKEAFQPEKFCPRSSYFEILDASAFLSCPLAEMICTKAMLTPAFGNDLPRSRNKDALCPAFGLDQGNAIPYMLQAKARGCATLFRGAEEYCRLIFRNLEHPGLFDNPIEALEKPLGEFKLLLDNVNSNRLEFFLILGWVEFNPDERLAHLHELLDNTIIPEILVCWDMECFEPKLYSFEVGGIVDRVGGEPDEADARKKTWPSLTLLLTTEISWRYDEDPEKPHDLYAGPGIYFHKILDHFRWMKPIPYPDFFRGHHGYSLCAWEHLVYFLGGDKYKDFSGADIWTLDMSKLFRNVPGWKKLDAKMTLPRCNAAVAALEGKIYIFGGSRPYEYGGGSDWELEIYDTAECFDIGSGEWQPISPLPDGGVTDGETFIYEGRIFIVGGRASKEALGQAKPLQYGPHRPCCDDAPEPEPEKPVLPVWRRIWAYDPASDTYERVTEIPEESRALIDYGVVVVGSILYLIGGSDFGNCSDWHQLGCPCDVKNTVLGFDLSKRTWLMDLPQLKYPRKNSACFYDGNHLVVAGGTGNRDGELRKIVQELLISEPIIEPFTWECREELPIGMAFQTVQFPVPHPLMCKVLEMNKDKEESST